MRHDRTDIAVAQVKHALDDVLFDFLHFAAIKAFFDNCFDFFFRHLVIFRRVGPDQFDGQGRTFGQQPHERRGNQRE